MRSSQFGMHEAGEGISINSTSTDVIPLCNKSAWVPMNISHIILLMTLVITSSAGCHAGKSAKIEQERSRSRFLWSYQHYTVCTALSYNFN